MQTDRPSTPTRPDPRDATRREILELLSDSGFAPAQGIEALIDRMRCRDGER